MAPFSWLRRALGALEASTEPIHIFGNALGEAVADKHPVIADTLFWLAGIATTVFVIGFFRHAATKVVWLSRWIIGKR